jgi:hypothetical protein
MSFPGADADENFGGSVRGARAVAGGRRAVRAPAESRRRDTIQGQRARISSDNIRDAGLIVCSRCILSTVLRARFYRVRERHRRTHKASKLGDTDCHQQHNRYEDDKLDQSRASGSSGQ